MAMLSHTELRKGTKIEVDGQPYQIVDAQFTKPGKGQAFTVVRLKNLLGGNVIERTYKSSDKAQKADVEARTCQYLYNDGETYHCMDMNSYEQFAIPKENLGDAWKWMMENMECSVVFWQGRALSVDVPNFVELEITQCEPGVKGDTAQGGSKPATMSTGAVVHVPLFVNEGEWIRVDTRTGEYSNRVKK